MKSPFPGMDPYLEQWWRDVHHSLCTYARDAIQAQLSPDLRARIDERRVVETDEGGRSIYPDVRVVEHGTAPAAEIQPAQSVALAEPLLVEIQDEPARQGFIEIVDIRHGGRVITVIEFVSPSNRLPGDAQTQYLRKQREFYDAGVSLVEIDLVRTGKSVTMVRPHLGRPLAAPYHVCVFRASKKTRCEVYPIALQSPLPTIRVPLRQTDADALLNLQALIEQVYRNGAYAHEIDYRSSSDPPLTGEDETWAQQVLTSAGKR